MQLARLSLLLVFASCASATKPQPTRSDSGATAASIGETAQQQSAKSVESEASAPAAQASAPASTVDLTRERTLIEESEAARKTSDYGTARAKAAEALTSLLARPEAQQDLDWLRLLNAAGLSAFHAQDARTANIAWQRVYEVRSRTLPQDHLELQGVRHNVALTLLKLGDLRAARALFEQVLEVRTRALPDDHPELQATRLALAGTLQSSGDLRGALALQQHVLEVCTRTLPDDHADLQAARLNLAGTMKSLGDLSDARVLIEQVLAVYTRTLPDDHPYLQAARRTLAATIRALGELPAARVLNEKVLEVSERTLPKDHPELQAARQDLAVTLEALGDLQRARALEELVLEANARTLPDDHPTLQVSRHNLAVTLQRMGELASARALFEKVLEVRERTLPDDHPELQTDRLGVASTMSLLGEYQEARPLFEKVVDVYSRTLPDDHPSLQVARQNLAVVLQALEDFAGARALIEQILEVDARTLPDEHARMLSMRRDLAYLLASEYAAKPAEPQTQQRFVDLSLDYAHGLWIGDLQAIVGASSREAEERVSDARSLGALLSMAQGFGVFDPDPVVEQQAFLLMERTRSVALVSARLVRAALANPDSVALRARVMATTDRLAVLGHGEASSEAFAVARAEYDEAQRALVRLGAQIDRTAQRIFDADLAECSSRLANDTAWVGYRRYLRSTIVRDHLDSAKALGPSNESLCAFILRADNRLTCVELGPIEPVELAILSWRSALGTGSAPRGGRVADAQAGGLTARGEALRRLLVDPLQHALGGVRRIVVAVDDVLHLVPLDALPVTGSWIDRESHGPDGASASSMPAILGDVMRVDTCVSMLELLDDARTPLPDGCLVVVGDIDYGREHIEAAPATAVAVANTSARDADRSGILRDTPWQDGFDPLPGSREEARGIAALMAEAGVSEHLVELLDGTAASRDHLAQLATSARFLHIATHGWYAPESIKSWSDPEPIDKQSGLGMRMSSDERFKRMSPMLLCGLALAGANLPADVLSGIPGLVTAEEISNWNLSHCELAVLSACDTNVGINRAGQGVASLQKALQMAGARSVITSLWRVPDEATKELMLDFYRRLWVEKKPKWQALWEAKLMIRNAKDGRGQPKYTTRDWAAWVLTGDPN